MPGVIYRRIAVTVVVSKRWINVGLMLAVSGAAPTFPATLSGIRTQTAHVSTAKKLF